MSPFLIGSFVSSSPDVAQNWCVSWSFNLVRSFNGTLCCVIANNELYPFRSLESFCESKGTLNQYTVNDATYAGKKSAKSVSSYKPFASLQADGPLARRDIATCVRLCMIHLSHDLSHQLKDWLRLIGAIAPSLTICTSMGRCHRRWPQRPSCTRRSRSDTPWDLRSAHGGNSSFDYSGSCVLSGCRK
jgi:hypothetical protein